MAILSKGTTYADGGQITSANLNALVDSATFAAGAVESGGGLQLNGSSPAQLKVAGNVDIGTSNLTATGSISLGATTFNDNNITNVGSIALDTITNDGTDVTIDSSGDIILDAGGADIRLKDDGTQFGRLANSSSNLVVASSVSDKDILFQGSDGGSTITALTLDMSAAGAATFNDKITAVGTSVFTNLDISGDVDVDGTINLDAVDIDGNVQVDGTVTVGVDDTGYDVKFFGATSGAYIQFDASADKLLTAGGATVDIVKDKLLIGGTAITTTAAELNVLDGVTAGTVTASKGVVVDSNKDISSFRNITLTGELDAGSLDVSGDADIDGTLETDALSIASTAVTATAAELNYNDTGAAVGTVVASKTVTVDSNKDVSSFRNITLTGELDAGSLDVSGDIDVDGTANLDVVDIDGAVDMATTLAVAGNVDFNGDLDVDGTTNLDAVDIDGAVDMASNLTIDGELTVKGGGSGSIVVNDEDSSLCPTMTFLRNGGGTTGNDFIKFENSGGEVAAINATGGGYFSGNVGIGNASPSKSLVVNENDSECVIVVTSSDSGTAGIYFGDQSDEIIGGVVFDNSTDKLQLRSSNNNTAVTIDSSESVGIGENSPSVLLHVGTGSIYQNKTGSGAFPGTTDTTSHGFMAESQGAAGSTIHVSRTNSAAGIFARQGTGDVVLFNNTNSSVTEAGSIEITGATSVAYRTSSDYRLKENVVDVTDGIDRVKELKPVRFNFIGEDPVVDGFLAHEVQDIVPEAIGGEKDAVDEEGRPDYQGIDQSKLVPLLTAALQEAVAKIEALEARVQTLEG